MDQTMDLSRFIEAHKRTYRTALEEIRSGRKYSHWMWFIFPQVRGLGHRENARYYAIRDLDEAAAFLRDPYLGGNLREICRALLELNSDDPVEILGRPDDLKLRSSMTLFSLVPEADPVFQKVLDKFYGGRRDYRTLEILGISAR